MLKTISLRFKKKIYLFQLQKIIPKGGLGLLIWTRDTVYAVMNLFSAHDRKTLPFYTFRELNICLWYVKGNMDYHIKYGQIRV